MLIADSGVYRYLPLLTANNTLILPFAQAQNMLGRLAVMVFYIPNNGLLFHREEIGNLVKYGQTQIVARHSRSGWPMNLG